MVDLYHERNRRQEELSGEVKEAAFDPVALGFKEYIPRRYAGSRGMADKDYIIFKAGTERTNRFMCVSLCEDTARFVTDTFGEKVGVYSNDKGQIMVTAGNAVKLGKATKTGRRKLPITGIADEMFDAHGKFKRLDLVAKPYGGFNAVLFSPDGEKVPL